MVILTDQAAITPYLRDESRCPAGSARAVLIPSTLEDCAEALREAAARREPVTVSGAGTGVTGGRVPAGGVVLSTERLRGVRWDRERMICGAGVCLAEIHAAAAEAGRWYGPDPTEWSASLGGTLATNASGARSFGCGSTRDWVLGAVVLLADGTRLDLVRGACRAQGGRLTLPSGRSIPAPDWAPPCTSKHAAGYYSAPEIDLLDLFIGSEGTLGVVVEATLRTEPAPAEVVAGLLLFDAEADAFGLVEAARARGGVQPLSLEFFDAAALRLARGFDPQVPVAAAGILFEQAVGVSDRVDPVGERWLALAEACQARGDSWFGRSAADRERLRAIRHAVPVAVNRTVGARGVVKLATDAAVPRGEAPAWLQSARARLDQRGLEHVTFGHIGDDHLHVNILARDDEQVRVGRETLRELLLAAVARGGTVSAEHGLGRLKRDHLALMYSPAVLSRMNRIRRALDPLAQWAPGIAWP